MLQHPALWGTAVLLGIGTATAAPLPPLHPAALSRAIAGLPDQTATAAVVVVSGSAGRWHGTSGVSDRSTSGPVPDDARFRIGSITKTFVATVLLQLAGEHRVDLDAAAQRYLPQLFPATDPPIPVRSLLNHTSGLSTATVRVDDPQWYLQHRFDTWTPRALVAPALSRPLDFRPGSEQRYNNTDYVLASMIIERVTRDSLADQLQRRILTPLGLRATSMPVTQDEIPAPSVHGYLAVANGAEPGIVDVSSENPSITWGEGSMVSDAPDLLRFITALFGGRLLPRQELAQMFAVPDVPYLGRDNCPGGHACFGDGLTSFTLNGVTMWGHPGQRPGYSSGLFATRDLQRRVAFLVTSTDFAPVGMPPVEQRIAAAVCGLT